MFLTTLFISIYVYLTWLMFSKVHCISTEFTPKKHGGERGVPFRLQIETFNSDGSNSRLHAGACILQVFILHSFIHSIFIHSSFFRCSSSKVQIESTNKTERKFPRDLINSHLSMSAPSWPISAWTISTSQTAGTVEL